MDCNATEASDQSQLPPKEAASKEGGSARIREPQQHAARAENPPAAGAWTDRLMSAWQVAYERLQAERSADGHWVGELSTSALSTATAISALVQVRQHHCFDDRGRRSPLREQVDESIEVGSRWLLDNQNADGGFGDTDRSHSNIATTLLVLAAWELAGQSQRWAEPTAAAWRYVEQQGGWDGLRRRYGKDKTFVVPILSNCALAGLVPWSDVPPLPFEAAWLPQDWYRWAQMPVVSYAIPALVAIGQATFQHAPPKNPLVRAVRQRAVEPTLRVLERMQPASGGYLEAVPLTSFVLMNLASIGRGKSKVSQACLQFILDSRLSDGSWPIDTNLATWVTSLSLNAMAQLGQLAITNTASTNTASTNTASTNTASTNTASKSPRDNSATVAVKSVNAVRSAGAALGEASRVEPIPAGVVRWLLSCQHKRRHPFTGANPGGWGWTDLSGAVPDADDTPAALLALSRMEFSDEQHGLLRTQVHLAVRSGLGWLIRLQNRDGGWPTFCRGWGKLPFDRSGSDLTAHALRAIAAWQSRYDELAAVVGDASLPSPSALRNAQRNGLKYLARNQQPDGSWLPLWFGNQDREHEDNPVYGTGRALLAYADLAMADAKPVGPAIEYLRTAQNADGGWGGGPSVVYRSRQAATSHQNGLGGNAAGNGGLADAETTSSIEETAVALEALLRLDTSLSAAAPGKVEPADGLADGFQQYGGEPQWDATIMRGLGWLCDRVLQGDLQTSWPIGFYFAKLWYHEKTYPTVFSVSALGIALKRLQDSQWAGPGSPDA